jgi:tetratricopeptide (TPR) repeat protein
MTRTSVLVAIVLCWAICLAAAVCAVAQDDEHPNFIAGVDKYNKGEYTAAVDDFAKATQAEPDFEPGWYYLGVSRYKASPADLAGALDALNKALELAPARVGTKFYIGRIFEAKGDYEDARRAYQEEITLRRGRDEAEVFNSLGRMYLLLGNFDEAKDVLQRAIGEQPKYVEALYTLGLVYYNQKDAKAALKYYKRCNDIIDEFVQYKARVNRLSESEQRVKTTTEEQLEQQYGLARDFVTNLGLRPTLARAIGDAHLLARDWSSARTAYGHMLLPSEDGNPADPEAYCLIGNAFLRDARQTFFREGLLFTTTQIASSAERSYDEALKNDQNSKTALNGLGEVYAFEAATYTTDPGQGITSHSYEDAIAKFQAALKISPDFERALLNLGRAYLSLGDRQEPGKAEALDSYGKAKDALERALAISPKDPEILAEVARMQLALEQYDDALTNALTAIMADKNNIVALNTAGLVHYKRRELADAANFFSQAILADPTRPQSYTNLGNTYYQMMSWFRARLEYRNALKRTPEAAIARTAIQRSYLNFLIGATHYETGSYQSAVDSFNEALSLDPSYFDALRALSRSYQALKNYRAAERALKTALQKPPTDAAAAEVQCQMGEMYEQEGRIHEAIAAFGAALAIDPSNVSAQEGLQRIHAR